MKKRIQNLINTAKDWWKHPKKRYGLIAIILLSVLFIFRIVQGFGGTDTLQDKKETQVSLVSVEELQNENEDIKASGILESIEQVELRSEVSARVAVVSVKLGQQVYPGQTLVTFSNGAAYAQQTDAYARLQAAQAQASQFLAALEVQQSQLEAIKKGPREEELAISNTSVENAQNLVKEAENSYDAAKNKAKTDLDRTLVNGVSSLQRSVQVAADSLYTATNIQQAYFDGNNQDDIRIREAKRIAVDILLGEPDAGFWITEFLVKLNGGVKGELQNLSQNPTITHTRESAKNTSNAIRAVINLYNTIPFSNGISAGDIALISGEKIRLQAELQNTISIEESITAQLVANETALQASETALTNAKNGLESAKKQLSLVQAGASAEDIRAKEALVRQAQANYRAQQAQVLSARASISSASAQLAKTIIRSPIAGKVSRLPVRQGELVSPNGIVAAVVNDEAFQVKTFIDSSNLSDIAINASALINNNVSGTVHFVSPAIDPDTGKVEVIVLVTDESKENLVVGQYVDVTIERKGIDTNIVQAILPLQAIYVTEEDTSVFVVEDGKIVEKSVVLGRVRGKEVEILQGLENIEKIVSSVRDVRPGQVVGIK